MSSADMETAIIPPAWSPQPVDTDDLLTDEQVMDFIVRGFMILEPNHRPGLNESIDKALNAMKRNPGNGIFEAVPQLQEIYGHPKVRGALVSLLGPDVKMNAHRHWHSRTPGPWSQGWHQDGLNERHHQIRCVLGMYYPHDVTLDMGPTVVLPGSHFRNAPTDRMATYCNIRGQVPVVVKAGSIAVTHYDIWHGGTVNRSARTRHMLKFLFNRVSEPEVPSWNHDPDSASELAARKLAFDVSAPCGQSDSYKQIALRNQMWKYLLGQRQLAPAAVSFDDEILKKSKKNTAY